VLDVRQHAIPRGPSLRDHSVAEERAGDRNPNDAQLEDNGVAVDLEDATFA
jgi:hypothetical protein